LDVVGVTLVTELRVSYFTTLNVNVYTQFYL